MSSLDGFTGWPLPVNWAQFVMCLVSDENGLHKAEGYSSKWKFSNVCQKARPCFVGSTLSFTNLADWNVRPPFNPIPKSI